LPEYAFKYIGPTANLNEKISAIARANDVNFIDIAKAICPNKTCNILTDNSMPIYYDSMHTTAEADKYLSEVLIEQFEF